MKSTIYIKSVALTKETWKELNRLKVINRAHSMDELIKSLIKKQGVK